MAQYEKPRKNDRFDYFGKEAKIIANENGWIMARLKGNVPFVIPEKEIKGRCYRKRDGAKF